MRGRAHIPFPVNLYRYRRKCLDVGLAAERHTTLKMEYLTVPRNTNLRHAINLKLVEAARSEAFALVAQDSMLTHHPDLKKQALQTLQDLHFE